MSRGVANRALILGSIISHGVISRRWASTSGEERGLSPNDLLAANFGVDFRVARCILGTETWLKITGTTVDALRHYNLAMNYKGARDEDTLERLSGEGASLGKLGNTPVLARGDA